MKKTINNYKYLKALFVAIIFLFNGCDEKFTVITKVLKDGSCIRFLKVDYDKSPDFDSYPITIDTTWNKEMVIDTAGEKPDTFLLFSKHFPSVKEIYTASSDTGNVFSSVNRKVNLEKKFRWFYTEYEFVETFPKLFEGKPYMDFISKEDFDFINDEDNDENPKYENMDKTAFNHMVDSIETKMNEWFSSITFNVLYNAVYDALKRDPKFEKYISEYAEMKDSFMITVDYSEFSTEDVFDYFDNLDERIGANGEIDSLLENPDSVLQETTDKFEHLHNWFWDKYYYELQMPGMLTFTNADSVKNETMYFGVEWINFYTTDYEMKAVSKIKNIWSYYVSAGIGLLALIALVAGMARKKLRSR